MSYFPDWYLQVHNILQQTGKVKERRFDFAETRKDREEGNFTVGPPWSDSTNKLPKKALFPGPSLIWVGYIFTHNYT